MEEPDADAGVFDAAESEALARAVAEGDSQAFSGFVTLLWPEMLSILSKSRTMGPRRTNQDDLHNVGVRVIEKLYRDDFSALKLYPSWNERHPEKSFRDWLRIVIANVARDYLREEQRKTPGFRSSASPKSLLNAFVASLPIEDLGTRPPMTAAQTARQLLEFAEARLPAVQYAALSEWLQGSSFEELAAQLRLDGAEHARRLVRASLASLRRAFAESP